MDGDKAASAKATTVSLSKPLQVDPEDGTDTSEVTKPAGTNAEPSSMDTEVTPITVETANTADISKTTTSDIPGTPEVISNEHAVGNDTAPSSEINQTSTVNPTVDSENIADTAILSAGKDVGIVEIDLVVPEASLDANLDIIRTDMNTAISDDVVEINTNVTEIMEGKAEGNSDETGTIMLKTVASESTVETNNAETIEINQTVLDSETSRSTEPDIVDYNDDSLSERDAFSDSASDSMDEDYRDNRRNTLEQHPDNSISNDGDTGGEEQGQTHEEEPQAEAIDQKETSPQPPRKVDDDEDKNNPQYIPKRGTFYEHDYRTTEDVADEEKVDAEKEKVDSGVDAKKKMWHEKREKWSHDKFREDEQLPKSREELIAIYGYDIRNEDGPPRARRRRRYGRGPNKYTRNWEDEDAYYKTGAKKPPQVNKSGGELQQQPQLQQQQETAQLAREKQPRRGGSRYIRDPPQEREQIHVQDDKQLRGGQARTQSAGTGRIVRPNRDYASSDYQSFTKARNYNRGEQHPEQQQQYQQPRFRTESGNNGDGTRQQRQNTPPAGRYHGHQDNRDANMHQVDAGMASLSLQQQFDMDPSQQRKPVSKRYSSIRQRAFPDSKPITLSEAFAAHHKLNAELEQRERMVVQQQHQQHYYDQQQPPAGQVSVAAMCAPAPLGLPPPMPDTALAQQQRRFVGGVPAMAPAVPAQFISPPPPFLARPPQPPPPPINLNYQLAPQHYYQQQAPPPPPQFVAQPMAAEQLFQPQGGITYYSPEEQQTAHRHAPPLRTKVAIPILPPPPTPPPTNTTDTST